MLNKKNEPDFTGYFQIHGGFTAMNPGADFVQHLAQSPLAPEQRNRTTN